MPPIATARITPRGEDRIRAGHPWIYRSDVRDVTDASPGAVVRVLGARDKLLGYALFSDQSQIVLRMVARGDVVVDRAFWRGRLEAAIGVRTALGLDATAFRLVHGEADVLPSLIVDRYADVLVLVWAEGSESGLPYGAWRQEALTGLFATLCIWAIYSRTLATTFMNITSER